MLWAVTSLVMLPGTACDARLFAAQRAAIPEMTVLEWMPPIAGESPRDYAQRLARTATFPEDLILGGVSLGSIVAQELALLVRPRKLLLIGTARERAALRRARWFGSAVKVWPERAMHARATEAGVRWGGRLWGVEAGAAACVAEMFVAAHPGHVRWAMGAISSWTPPEALPCPTARLHGRRDAVIPLGRRNDGVAVIENGGHLINLTHPERVNAWIRNHLG